MPAPDFSGLRTAVEDAVEWPPYETLRARADGRRRRRAGLAAAGIAAVAALVAVAGPWTGPPPEPAAPPATSTPAPGSGAVPTLLGTAFGRTTTYTLLGSCTPVGVCSSELLVSADTGRSWTRLASPLRPPTGGDGFAAELRLTGDDDVAVVDPATARVHASTDGGRTFTTRPLRDGPTLDAVPPGLRAETTQCGGDNCPPARVVVLDPATGLRAPLRAQPITGSTRVGVATGDDGRIWVVGREGGRLVSALSTDRGRSWQPLSTPAGSQAEYYQLVPLPGSGAGAYLVTGRDGQQVPDRFADLWRLDGAGWVRVTPPGAPRQVLSAVGLAGGELLLTGERGNTWRTSGAGTRIAPDPDQELGGVPIPLFELQRAGSLVIAPVALPDLFGAPVLLVSTDGGRSWDRRTVAVR